MDASIPFYQAVNYTRAERTEIKWIVLHCMESAEKPSKAIDCAKWMAGMNSAYPAPRTSAHYFVDSEHTAQGVRDTDVAWAAPGANRFGLHVEHAGKSAQTRAEWLDAFSEKMLRRSAALTAGLAIKWSVPLNFVGPTELRAGIHGFTDHRSATRAWPELGGTHTDPGPAFVWDWYMTEVQLKVAELVRQPNV